ncbi:MAG: cation:proton antiporter [Chloroflexi bacterium]|nr:cation:proton antiporter [Chloroflexota bacterium]MCI0647939.1 cation:proton antiporter [Chloroflexota bacterium]MCI0726449.1 cation:proton antiporter [Chloroflexota bacterium]
MQSFGAAPHHDVLVLLIQVAVLLLAARALGEIAQRLGQPAVVGEILAGIVLGPSFLSTLLPGLGQWLVPQTAVQGYLLEVVSLLGVMFLLLITGLETDLVLIRRHARMSLSAAGGGLIVPFATGFMLGLYLPDFLLANPDQRLVFALFVAAALSISAIPVIAKVLMDLNLMRRDIGQAIIAAGMVDDTTAWIVLSVILGLASGEAVTAGFVLQSVLKVAAFLAISFTAGRWLVKRALDFVQDEVISQNRLLTLVVVMAFAWGVVTQAIGLEALFGAFIMGILFGQMPRLPEFVRQKLESVALGIFSPIFFAVAGLKVNVINLFEPQLIVVALVVIAVATIGKVVGAYAGARLIGGRDHWTALSFGAGLNARGAMEIIIATIGLNLGILTQDMFSIIVLMAMTTSLMAPPALRWVLKNVKPEEQELRRLRQEELAARSLVANIHRILLPVRQHSASAPVQAIEARVLEKLGAKSRLSLTLLNVAEPGGRAAGVTFLNHLNQMFLQKEVVKKVVEGSKPADIVLDEAKKDYDLLVFGASDASRSSEILFTPLVDYLVRLSPCPTMVVQCQRVPEDWRPRCILVPTNGSMAARRAAELGFALAWDSGDEVAILHVIVENTGRYHLDASGEMFKTQIGVGYQIVDELRELGQTQGIHTGTRVQVGPDPESIILDVAREKKVDLIILGTDVRPGSGRLFLGPRVERVLKDAPCPVIVFNS